MDDCCSEKNKKKEKIELKTDCCGACVVSEETAEK